MSLTFSVLIRKMGMITIQLSDLCEHRIKLDEVSNTQGTSTCSKNIAAVIFTVIMAPRDSESLPGVISQPWEWQAEAVFLRQMLLTRGLPGLDGELATNFCFFNQGRNRPRISIFMSWALSGWRGGIDLLDTYIQHPPSYSEKV